MAKKKPAPKHEPEIATKIGRPVYWTEERAETAFQTICERLALGESLRAICADNGLPDAWTVMKWLRERPIFAQRYAHARELQAEFYAEAIIDIADGRLPPDKDALEIKLRGDGDQAVEVAADPVARDRLLLGPPSRGACRAMTIPGAPQPDQQRTSCRLRFTPTIH